jgi:UDP-N-acetyl-D-glucosamine dehydrogenase
MDGAGRPAGSIEATSRELLSRIQSRSARVGVIGQGYVGLPLALVFREAGFPVIGFDVDPVKVAALRRGESYIQHIKPDRVARAAASGMYEATTDFDRLADCDAILICVPTPLGMHREPDNSYIHETARAIAKRLRRGQLVVLESTTYPGTTDEEVLPILKTSGLETPGDFFLAFSPEREDPGNAGFSTRSIPKIVGGVNGPSAEVAATLYGAALDTVVPVSSSRVAESSKLLENVFRSVNIALVNELKMTFDRMGIDIWEVIEAAKTKPFGFMPFYPGPGLGGHCIPLDPFYLAWKAREHGITARFIELAGETNVRTVEYVLDTLTRALNGRGKPVRGSRVLVLGLAYKRDVADPRESPAFELIHGLLRLGAAVSYHDPHIPVAPRMRSWPDLEPMASQPLTAETLAASDAVLIVTDHSAVDYRLVLEHAPLVVDTRGVCRRLDPGRNSPAEVVGA